MLREMVGKALRKAGNDRDDAGGLRGRLRDALGSQRAPAPTAAPPPRTASVPAPRPAATAATDAAARTNGHASAGPAPGSIADLARQRAAAGALPPVAAPVVAAPVVAAPVVEAPVVEAPVVAAPVAEAPVVEAPVVAAPVVAAPIVTAPAPSPVAVAVAVASAPAPAAPPVVAQSNVEAPIAKGGIAAAIAGNKATRTPDAPIVRDTASLSMDLGSIEIHVAEDGTAYWGEIDNESSRAKAAGKHLLIDQPECIACGTCVENTAAVFVLPDDAKAVAFRQAGPMDLVQDAIDACPVTCIHWVDEADKFPLLNDAEGRPLA